MVGNEGSLNGETVSALVPSKCEGMSYCYSMPSGNGVQVLVRGGSNTPASPLGLGLPGTCPSTARTCHKPGGRGSSAGLGYNSIELREMETWQREDLTLQHMWEATLNALGMGRDIPLQATFHGARQSSIPAGPCDGWDGKDKSHNGLFSSSSCIFPLSPSSPKV